MFQIDSYIKTELAELCGTTRGKECRDKLRDYWHRLDGIDEVAAVLELSRAFEKDLMAVIDGVTDLMQVMDRKGEKEKMQLILYRLLLRKARENRDDAIMAS